MSIGQTLDETGFTPVTPRDVLPCIFRKDYAPTLAVFVIANPKAYYEVWVRNPASEVGVGSITYGQVDESSAKQLLGLIEQAFTAGNAYGTTAQSVLAEKVDTPRWRSCKENPPARGEVVALHLGGSSYGMGCLVDSSTWIGALSGLKFEPTPNLWSPLPTLPPSKA